MTVMKAAQYFGPNDIRVVETPSPTPQSHEALIAVSFAGICGSDLHEYLYGPFSCPPPTRPHPLTNSHIPVTLGHEFVGRIISAPSSSPQLKEGTPVVIDPRLYCRSCKKCKRGFTHGCDSLGFKGLSGGGGGFAERVCVDARQVYALPPHVELEKAALIEPLAVGWHAVKTTGFEDWGEMSVLVVGGGPVGVAVMIVLRAFACRKIIVSEPTVARRLQNESVADVVLNPLEEDIGARCREVTAGDGVDVVFDCAGNQKGFEAGMDAVRYRGVYMNVAAWFGTPMQIPFFPFLLKEVTIKCCLAYTDEEFKDVVDAFAAGRFNNLETMVTSKIYIDDIVTKGFDELVAKRDQHVKILVSPHVEASG
ncbi:hypothetical protein E8E12_000429 [Didymella heteroderae]|uniref:Enoyl reductase (ER) domain-containing protein n=1 Tax=Didymella heteroderae TaxID=1769908 RepID=A0A9P4WG56_9PLEO|nr:hypothetical protein E8E12_000429 [Didymella heteroderae]